MKTFVIHHEDGTEVRIEGDTADLYDGMVTVYKITTVDRSKPTREIVYHWTSVGVVDITTE